MLNPDSHRYAAYGLTISSCLALDLEAAADGCDSSDVTVRRHPLPHVGEPLEPGCGSAFAGGTPQALAARSVGRFAAEARDGREILFESVSCNSLELLADYVAGPMLGFVLLQRGFLVLHASCVAIDGRAVVIAGFSGQGKSTTAAALVWRGHSLICDDIATLTEDHRVLPGPHRLRLAPDVAATLPDALHGMRQQGRRSDKRLHRPPGPAQTGPVPLHRIYVLGTGVAAIEGIGPTAAVVELVRHTYAIRAIQHTAQQPSHFHAVGRLLGAGLVRRLWRPLDLAGLPALARMIEQDVCADRLANRGESDHNHQPAIPGPRP